MRLNNATTTLAHGLGSSQGRLVRIEVFIFLSTFIWLLLEMFGTRRRRYSHRFLRVFVWTVYTLFTVLIPYTIGLLQDGLFRDQTFALWGTVILLIQLTSDSISVYSIQDIEQRKRMLVQHVLQIILVLWMIVNGKGHNKCYSATTWMLWIWSVLMTYRKSRALSKASKKGGMLEHSKVVADYMMVEHEQTAQQVVGTNQSTVSMMDRYRYIFHGEEELASMLPTAPQYRFELKESTITIDSVWRWLDSHGDLGENVQTVKDVTLSFTLFKLLKRRFCGYQLGEVGLPKTKDFVFHVLMSESQSQNASNGYLGAFRVIELELAFLYDFFYTRSDLESLTYLGYFLYIVVPFVTVWNFISGAFSRHYHRSNMQQRVNETDVIHGATIVLLAVWLIVLVSTCFCHRASIKWVLVDIDMIQQFMAGRRAPYVNTIAQRVKNEQAAHLLWERKLGQYTMLLNFDYQPCNAPSILSLRLIEATRQGQKPGKKIKLTEEVVVHVLSQFKESSGHLENGRSALARNQLGTRFSWACKLPTHTHMILAWHIGTTLSIDGNEEPLTGDRLVAKSLSDYCAYLVAFVPEMLLDHFCDTQRIFDVVVMETRKCLAGCDTMSSRCEKLMMMVLPDNNSCTILEMGAKLGKELKGVVPEELRWKVLADFWAEFLLFLAPSSNAEIHGEMLAAGGEFMTHLWALLTHAGIVDRPSSSSTTSGEHDSIV